MERKDKEIGRDTIREDVLEKMKEEYYQEDVVMSEFLRSQEGLSIAEKRELLRYAGDDEFMAVLGNGEIASLEDIYEEIVTGLNEVVEAIEYDVESNGFGYSGDGLAALDEGDLVGFYEGFLWLKKELRDLKGLGDEDYQIVEGLNIALEHIGYSVYNQTYFVFNQETVLFAKDGDSYPISKGMNFLLEKMIETGLFENCKEEVYGLFQRQVHYAGEGRVEQVPSPYVVSMDSISGGLQYFDIYGDCSHVGTKEEILEDLREAKYPESEIQKISESMEELLGKCSQRMKEDAYFGLNEKITEAKERVSVGTLNEKCSEKELGRG